MSPLVWRRLLVASDTSIAELHEILQGAFDWSGEHLHRFLIHGAAYGIRCLGGIVFQEDARRVPLSRFGLHCGERFRYEYDFTADWTLDIRGSFDERGNKVPISSLWRLLIEWQRR